MNCENTCAARSSRSATERVLGVRYESSHVTGPTIFADGGRLPLNYVVPVAEEG